MGDYSVYGALRRPSCFTTQLPSDGNPGESPWDPFQPAAIYATAYKKPAFPGIKGGGVPPVYTTVISEFADHKERKLTIATTNRESYRVILALYYDGSRIHTSIIEDPIVIGG
jgi:hypothetical protein